MQGSLFDIPKETRLDALLSVNKEAVREVIRHFASRVVKPFDAFDLCACTGLTLLAIRPRLTEMSQDGELKIVGKHKTQYSRTAVCIYEKK